jgi:hypothetical protein
LGEENPGRVLFKKLGWMSGNTTRATDAERQIMDHWLSRFKRLTSSPGPRFIQGVGEHFHTGWDFAEPDAILVKRKLSDLVLIFPSASGGFGLLVKIPEESIIVELGHMSGFRETPDGILLFRGGWRGLLTSGRSTGPHWHIQFRRKTDGKIIIF